MLRSAEIRVSKEENLHLRPMQLLVEKAAGFKSRLTIKRGARFADAKSILDVMMLAAERGPLAIEAEGCDADAALDALSRLLHDELNKG